jgi:ketosteroid isomerase-like protein
MFDKKQFAAEFAAEWLHAWNDHDLARILSHYADDFEMSSPIIIEVAGEPSGRLKGKKAVGAYWAKALERLPDLHFDLVSTLVGVDSVTLYYRGHRGMVAEVFFFGADGKVVRAYANYEIQASQAHP